MREGEPVHVVVGRDGSGWHERFVSALETVARRDPCLSFQLASLDGHDWLDRVEAADMVIWNPARMGPIAASHYKEKVYYLEHFMGKRVVPNYATVWHFESKVAQSYLLHSYDVPQPRTWVSFEWDDALDAVVQLGLPLVAKASYGAGSSNVRLIRRAGQVRRHTQWRLSYDQWQEAKTSAGSKLAALPKSVLRPWFWYAAVRKLLGRELTAAVYFQSFVPANQRDLRVTVIGRRAYAFWRKNRPRDFRASGSGLIDYGAAVPEEVLRQCIEWSTRMGFDSMAYDIVFADDIPLVLEISYSYVASALASAPCHWALGEDGDLQRIDGAVWPQELWVVHALGVSLRADAAGGTGGHDTYRGSRTRPRRRRDSMGDADGHE